MYSKFIVITCFMVRMALFCTDTGFVLTKKSLALAHDLYKRLLKDFAPSCPLAPKQIISYKKYNCSFGFYLRKNIDHHCYRKGCRDILDL